MTASGQKWVIGLGELLWDLLPRGAELGGAVSNFAVMAGRLGDRGICASRVGNDSLGRQARERLAALSADTAFLQVDPRYPTGSVSVAFQDGQPEYVIHQPVAWDSLHLTEEWVELAGRADAVCFGTLAQRSPVSREAIEAFLAATSPRCVRVFDVNLRPPFYSAEVIEKSLRWATVLKMNDAEMPLVLDAAGVPGEAGGTAPHALLEGARRLLEGFPIDLICITMGQSGSLLVTREEVDRHPGIPTQVVDTVGAGDAFTAALTHYYLRNAPLAVLSEAGNRWGAWVASRRGAMPALDAATCERLTMSLPARGAPG